MRIAHLKLCLPYAAIAAMVALVLAGVTDAQDPTGSAAAPAVAAAAAEPAADAASPDAAAAGRHYALLIGCTAYPGLGEKYQLEGPANDVALTGKLLKERFQFADDEIVTMLHEHPESLRPTGANIAREFAALAQRAAVGDQVFVMIAGHGSQLVNDNSSDDAKDPEPDGLDEVFLPEDTTEWSLSKPAVGAIRDDQIGVWLDAIRDRGAFVFFVADTCHAGTMDRGGPDPASRIRTRYVDPKLLNAMRELEAATKPRKPDPKSLAPIGVADTTELPSANRGALIALYAVSDSDQETEEPMPPYERTDNPVYGRLAYAMNDVLTRAREPLTYHELAQQIGWRYQGWDWRKIGMLTGTENYYKKEVLGSISWPDRSDVILHRTEYGDMSIEVGQLHGVTVGSVYRVFLPAGADGPKDPVGCVIVTEATPTTARVVPTAYDGIPEIPYDQFPIPARCELAFTAAPSLKLLVAVGADESMDGPVDLAPVVDALREIADRPKSLIALAAKGEAPDAYLLASGTEVLLRRAADATFETNADDLPESVFGPFPRDGSPGSELSDALEAMAKATNIRRLAESDKFMVIGDKNFPVVKLEVTVERLKPDGKYEKIEDLRQLDLYHNDQLRVTMKNLTDHPVDLTVLYIDASFKITSYLPTIDQITVGDPQNRLNGEHTSSVPFTIWATPSGLEDVIIIATLTDPGMPEQNFTFLEQEGISRDRGDENSALNSPLGQLLAMAAFASGDRGGNEAPDIAKYAVHRLSWTVHPQSAEGR